MIRSVLSQIEWRMRAILLGRPAAPEMVAPANGPVIVVGLIGTASGIGRSARMCVRGLREQDVDVSTIDLSGHLGQMDIESVDGMLRLPESPVGTAIVHINPPEFERALYLIKCYRRHGWRVIGYWVWELPVLPESWTRVARYVSEVWTPSDFVTSVLETVFQCPVSTVPHAIFPPDACKVTSPASRDHVSFLTLADGRSSLVRKGVVEAVQAFQAAFPNDEQHKLTVKCRNLDAKSPLVQTLARLVEGDDRITLREVSLSELEQWRLLAQHDVLISMHRSEGYGLALAEAMALGKTVVATGWSGNTMFMTDRNSVLIPYVLEAVDDPTGIYPKTEGAEWATPNMEAAIDSLRQLASEPNLRKRLGHQAAEDIVRLNGTGYKRALEVYSVGT